MTTNRKLLSFAIKVGRARTGLLELAICLLAVGFTLFDQSGVLLLKWEPADQSALSRLRCGATLKRNVQTLVHGRALDALIDKLLAS